MDKKDLENNNPQMSAMEAFRKTQKQIDEINSAIGFPHNLLKMAEKLNPKNLQNAFVNSQKISEQLSPLSQILTNPEINRAMDSLNESIASKIQNQAQFISPKGFVLENQIGDLNIAMSKATEVFSQLDLVSNLESFNAIYRLKNFPFNALEINNNKNSEYREDVTEDIVKLDKEISKELTSVEDFNDLSEEKRSALLALHKNYYTPILLQALAIVLWWKTCLDEKIDLSNMTFIFVENTKQAFSYINYQPNFSSMLDSIFGGAILMVLVEIFKYIKNLSK